MKKTLFSSALVALAFCTACQEKAVEGVVIEAAEHGAVGDGTTLNTEALNKMIQEAPEGATIHIGAGKYLTGTIHLKSNLTLDLDSLAEIIGVTDLDAYDHYKPTKDMTRYDTGEGSVNANLSGDERWTKALVLGQNIENVTIKGKGTFNGQHVVDSLGEESMRGPHGILIAESKNITLENFYIKCASNYAVLGYELENSTVDGLTIHEGWDGVHIRGGENLTIKNCDIQTGDDAIAGGYWKNMTIKDCKLNSSCNGIRMIEPSTDLTIKDCYIYGPGVYYHRTSGPVTRSIYGIVLEPGAWGDAPGHTENVVIQDVKIDNVLSPVVYSMGEDNTCSGLTIDGLKATHITFNTTPLNRQECVRMWDNIKIKDLEITMNKDE
ncbi:MAG: right-handed parallel beta-helix repeat-containing protein [Bacteroidaceae bacterium]|nr:right-handed parallel beta-helix repeat-containing protein [Bacteroidaceae bacterium]